MRREPRADTSPWTASQTRSSQSCPEIRKQMIEFILDLNFCIFFSGLECVGHSFARVAQFVFLTDVWIRTQRAPVASKRATNLATHLTGLATHLTGLATHLTGLATHHPDLGYPSPWLSHPSPCLRHPSPWLSYPSPWLSHPSPWT